MKKIYLVMMYLVWQFSASSQPFIPEQYTQDTTHKMLLRTSYHFNYHTSSLPNYFTNYFLNGGTISNEIKDKVSSKLKSKNTAGAEQAFAIKFYDFSSHPFKDSTWGYYLNLEHQDHIGLNFSKNLFDLVFYGNGPFVGETINLTPFRFSRMTYQKVGFGLCDSETGTSFGISVVKGQSFTSVQFDKADFFTDDSTANISFDYGVDMVRSDTGKTNFSAFNGTGLAIDMNWNFKLWNDSILPDLANWQLRLNNAGFLIWNVATLNFDADSSVQFNGFEVNNILKPEEGLLTGSTDLSDTVKIKYIKKKYNSLLPADVVLGNTVDPFKGYWLKPLIGGRYKLMDGYKPMAYAGAVMRVGKKSFFQVSVSYGGFGGFRSGLKFQTSIGKKIGFLIGSSHVDGLYSSNSFGKDGYFSLWMRF